MARNEKMTPQRRQEIARLAAQSRWKKKQGKVIGYHIYPFEVIREEPTS
jgi:hypothetical protein